MTNNHEDTGEETVATAQAVDRTGRDIVQRVLSTGSSVVATMSSSNTIINGRPEHILGANPHKEHANFPCVIC